MGGEVGGLQLSISTEISLIYALIKHPYNSLHVNIFLSSSHTFKALIFYCVKISSKSLSEK